MSGREQGNWLLLVTILAAFVLTLLPLPEALAPWRPYWMALVVIYWSLETARLSHLGQAFILGLLLDLATGSLLGQHALSLIIISYLLGRFRARIRFFPPWQQATAIFVLLLNDRIVQLWVVGLVGDTWPPVGWWLAPVVGVLVWPWMFLLIDALRLRQRRRA